MLGKVDANRWRYCVSALIAMLGLFAITTPILAARDNQTITLSQGQTVNHDYFAAGSIVEVDGTVNGDIYAAGGQVIINGTVNGDVLTAGGQVTIDGTVNGNVRVAGGNVVVDGHIAKNLSVAGGSVELAHPASIGGSVAAASGNLQDSSTINGDVNAATGHVTVGSDAHIGGSVTYWSNQVGTIASGTVAGTVTHRIPPMRQHSSPNGLAVALFTALYWLVVTFVLALLLLWWLPRHSAAVTKTIRERPLQSIGWGIFGIVVTPVAGIILMITLIGIPLALSLWALYAVALVLAPVWVIMATRELLSSQMPKENTVLVLLVAAVIYALIGVIPFIGVLFIIITGLIGLGASLSTGYGTYQHLRRKNEI